MTQFKKSLIKCLKEWEEELPFLSDKQKEETEFTINYVKKKYWHIIWIKEEEWT